MIYGTKIKIKFIREIILIEGIKICKVVGCCEVGLVRNVQFLKCFIRKEKRFKISFLSVYFKNIKEGRGGLER